MKMLRIVVPLLLLLIAAPSFAALCGYCDVNCNCNFERGDGTRCKPTFDCCIEIVDAFCVTAGNATPSIFAADFTIASVDVVTPAKHVVTTTEPRVAERTPRPDPRSR